MKKPKLDNAELNSLRLIRGRALKQGDRKSAIATLKEISVIVADKYKDAPDPKEYLFQ